MGHLVGKDIYRKLGTKIDNLHVRAPWNKELNELLRAIVTPEEAELIVKMPFLFSGIDRISQLTKMPKVKLAGMLETLSAKGMVMDFFIGCEFKYMPSPFVVGIFEFTMMRSNAAEKKSRAKLLTAYLDEGSFLRENFPPGSQISVSRAVPHKEALGDHVEILDYEKVESFVAENDRFALTDCCCRHAREHSNAGDCAKPLHACTSFGHAADYLVKNGMARKSSREEVLDKCQQARDMGLVFETDNVKKQNMFLCLCCGCCCEILLAMNTHGISSALVTSTCIAEVKEADCTGCTLCAKECPVNAISMVETAIPNSDRKSKVPLIDTNFCMGCGVCSLKCRPRAIKLEKRGKRVIHPETTFERVILSCLERGTLQNQIFDNPESMTQDVMRGLVGGFLRLSPVKKALMSDLLRSTFLKTMSVGNKLLGKGYIEEL